MSVVGGHEGARPPPPWGAFAAPRWALSYVAIARKWRPNTFEDIAGQTHVTRTLQNALTLGRIHHALLFTGARGVGKTTAARVMARALNCEQGPTATPCGVCASCVEILAGNSPDVIEIDGASNNSVDDVRELRDAVRYLPQRGRRKVYIVDEVHMLSKGAFNALLKTLEEPPAHVVFLFATTEPQKIPDTILSRVQRFDFKRIPGPVVVERLRAIAAAEGAAVDEAALRMIARAGDGSMRDSQSLLDRVIAFCGASATAEQVGEVLGLVDRSLLYDMLRGVVTGDADACLGAIERVDSFGFDLGQFVSELMDLVRNATMVALSPSSRRFLDVADTERAQLEALVKDTPADVLVRAFHVLLEVQEQVHRAARPRIVLEMAVARLVSIRPARGMDVLLQRLGDLERRVRGAGGPGPAVPGRGGGEGGEVPRAVGFGAAPGGRAPAVESRVSPVGPAVAAPVAQPAADPLAPPRSARPIGFARVDGARSPVGDAPPPPDVGLLDERAAEAVFGGWDAGTAESAAESVVPVDDDEPSAALTPPPVAADAGPAERFERFLDWCALGGARFLVLAQHSALERLAPPAVHVYVAHEFQQRNVQFWLESDWVRRGLSALFPGCDRLSVALRPAAAAGSLTRAERRKRERDARVSALEQALRADALVQRVQQVLDAQLVRVTPVDERLPGPAGD